MDVGDDWADEIVDVACTCGVMVAVYSPTYFTRPACGKEWAVVSGRAGGRPGHILPVNWWPTPERPEIASRPQLWGAEFGEDYANRGLHWIAQRMGKNDELERRYRDIVTDLATRIRDIVQAPDPLPPRASRPGLARHRAGVPGGGADRRRAGRRAGPA